MNLTTEYPLEFNSWRGMRSRCNNPNDTMFHRYGGRGIKVCERWRKFANFLEDMGCREKHLTIERTDNDGDYCPENCCWVSRKHQNNNSSCNKMLTFQGKAQSMALWADELGISYYVLRARLSRGWSINRAFTQAVGAIGHR